MSRVCSINGNKAVMSGNNVSHSNRKTKRRFLPNIQNFALWSDALNRVVRLDMTTSGARTVEHNNGIDNYLLSTANSKLTKTALLIKKQIKSAIAKKNPELNA
ncbi:MAG: 50S ribosomal protein L28 [Candidatus Midichloria sp.]|uniref:Large ribosomal subunit protein bL28c n=1 Tax=Hyalomma marginatum TaxID=34627 RepID=A0A8S4BVD1_9ACAR|nr:50S ribosomal protein L28 [Hyalomma marginatum]CAG7590864.1 50S ribosomal protein L28 [Hyalomma marginatum]